MKVHYFLFPGRAISKDNEKIFNRQGRPFTSKRFKDFEKYIKLSAKSQFEHDVLTGPVLVTMIFYFKNKVRPDLTNLPKSICDAFNKTVWADDRQIEIFQGSVKIDKNERIEVMVQEIDQSFKFD
jgi:Holliday junction resolvase RusA-like endonuclease